MAEQDQQCPELADNGRAELSPKQEAFVRALLACGGSLPAACEVACISGRTGRRYAAEPLVKAAIAGAHSDALRQAANSLAARCSEALGVLVALMRDKAESGGTRRMAARSVLDLALQYGEQVELSERMAELEAWRSEIEASPGIWTGGA